ncbi:MAG: hypothetical protein AB1403_02855 [Candidatus Riflebacteria bacterium]
MRNLRWLALVLFFVLVGSLTAEAVEFGYVKLAGRDIRKLRSEQASLEKLIRSWPEGQVLYVKLTMSGLFVQRNSILMIFAGEKKALESFLAKSPYEGDVIKELVGKFLFNFRTAVKNSDGKTVMRGKQAIGLVRRYANPHDLLGLIKNASVLSVYEKIRDPKTNVAGTSEKLSSPRGALKLFANKIRPENFLCDWLEYGFTEESNLISPPGWESQKEYTDEEIKENIENLKL